MRSFKRKIKTFLTSLVESLSCLRPEASILNYHQICSEKTDSRIFSPNEMLGVSQAEFDVQMSYISSHFECVSMEEFVRRVSGDAACSRLVTVTFDDGYYDNLENALPVLEKYSVPAVIYVSTGLIDSQQLPWWCALNQCVACQSDISFNWKDKEYSFQTGNREEKKQVVVSLSRMFRGLRVDEQTELVERICLGTGGIDKFRERILSTEEIRELAKHPLITIGSHTVNHPVMSLLTEEELERELKISKSCLEELTEYSVDYFAYPYGRISDAGSREYQATEKAGYKIAVTTELGHIRVGTEPSLFALPRVDIDYNDTLLDFRWKLAGLESLAKRVKTILKRD